MRTNQRRLRRIERNLIKPETRSAFMLIRKRPAGFEHGGKLYPTREEIPGYGQAPFTLTA